jgi:proteic killer suppression protein
MGRFGAKSGCNFRRRRLRLWRKLLRIHHARGLNDLRVPPGNRLEALKGDRKGQFSIRIDDQWRICFRWQGEDAFDVEVTDCHQNLPQKAKP